MTYLTYKQLTNEFRKRDELLKWKQEFSTYGKVFRIHRNTILTILIILCLITPFTNWLIPFLGKFVKNGIRW